MEPDPELAVVYGIFAVRQARAAGFGRAEIERLVRRGTWMRCGGGVLAVAGREEKATDPLVHAALRAGPQAVVGFASAAHLHGWDVFDRPPVPQLVTPLNGARERAYRTDLAPGDVEVQGILRATTPQRTALDIAATSAFASSVIALDSGLRKGRLTKQALNDYFEQSRRTGVGAARLAIDFADPQSGSVPETEARLVFASAGLPSPTSQYVVRTEGRFFALDFGWEEAMLGAEIDGRRYHSAAPEFQDDRTKQNLVQLDGWLILRYTVADIRDHPDRVVAQLRRGLSRVSVQKRQHKRTALS